jgi:hypothetical protein
MHVTHNGLKHAKQPTALNHIDLNKDPLQIVGHSEHSSHLHACNVKDTKNCSKLLSLSMPIAHPEIPCEALLAENFAVAPEGRTSNLCELSWMNVSHSSLGSLCYQIPTLDDIITAYSTVFSRHHEQDHCGDGFQSPT